MRKGSGSDEEISLSHQDDQFVIHNLSARYSIAFKDGYSQGGHDPRGIRRANLVINPVINHE
jgi:hypothetical protein